MRVKDKTAIVTGGGSGLGKAIAKRLAAEGATAVIADVNQAAIDATVAEITSAGHKAWGAHVDVTNRDAVRAFMEKVAAKSGRIDILVNNAGITRYRPFDELADEDWDAVLGLDLKAVFFCAQAASAYMVKQRYGKIVNISSILGTGTSPDVGDWSPGCSSAYASAKAGVIQLTKTLARELGPSGINVNCIAPGFFLTPLSGKTRSPEQVEKHIALRTSLAVLRRVGELEDLSNAVLFLASDEAKFIAGQTLCVDGGRVDRM
jgi:NAD(P)-dependent dehydrogenase (short-subunit alcohol dehydrogenase family)